MKICFDVLIFELPGNGLLVNLPKRRIRIRMMRCRVKLLVFELCFMRGARAIARYDCGNDMSYFLLPEIFRARKLNICFPLVFWIVIRRILIRLHTFVDRGVKLTHEWE